MDGSHPIERCEEVTGVVLHALFNALFEQDVVLEGMLLKPNMVVAGKTCTSQPSVEEVAMSTLRCLRRHVPAAVTGIVFLSGGQNARLATTHLNAGCQAQSLGKSASPTAGRFRIRLWILAWPGRESGGWPECPLSPRQLQQCSERGEIHR